MIETSLLDVGEECIWSARPNAMWFALRRAGGALLFGIACLLGSLVMYLQFNNIASQANTNPGFQITVGAILGLGSLAFFGVTWLGGTQTKYMLTNRRIVIDTAGPIPRRTNLPLEHVRFIELRSKFIGPSDLILMEPRRRTFSGWWPVGEGFVAIADAARVEKLVREAIDQTFTTRSRGPWQ